MNRVFTAADILVPQVDSMEKWAVIACDQFTSQPEYWQAVRQTVGDAPSALRLILPEAELGLPEQNTARAGQINAAMTAYLDAGIFREYPASFVYVERTLRDGTVRQGVLGAVDLEAYDYTPDATSAIRATEKTVPERIPPRVAIRRDAPLELPHVLLLCDDAECALIESLAAKKDALPRLYDFDLMADGGHIAGYLVQGETAADFAARLDAYAAAAPDKYRDLAGVPMLIAVGDGNHSLATAKACYEELKAAHPDEDFSAHPARYALAEFENIHAPAQQFEPIHRVLTGVDPQAVLAALQAAVGAEDGYPVEWVAGTHSGTVYLDRRRGQLPVGILQNFLDGYLAEHSGTVDYIHGDDVVRRLAGADGAIGFLLPAMEKGQLFRGIIADGVLPRKTFSMGHAQEKRYYLEARKIK